MKRMLFNATHQEELRVAIVDGQKLIDLDIETAGREQRKGNIYKGVITRIEPGLEACFVNYGEERHGFLPFKEVARSYFKEGVDHRNVSIQEALKEGQELIVQVEKEERGNKGAALTTFISLAGRYLVLMPNNPRGGGVSRRVEGEDRQELREAMEQLNVPQGMSLIARTAGIGRSVEELQWDLVYLMQLWTAIDTAARENAAPILIYLESSLVIRAIRDYFSPEIGEILIDTEEIAEQAQAFMSVVMPDNLHRVKMYRDDVPLFSRFQIEHQIETAYSRTVQLPSGGAVVIDHTEALVAIDVNSARSTRGADIEETALRTNLEAADEVARQLRLRDLGGLIVIDFIDMEDSKNQRAVEQRLRDALHFDRARVQMGKISRFGLMELSRQRLRPALNEGSHITCPRCNGTGVIRDAESSALHVLRLLQEEAMKENTAALHAQVPVEVATYLLNEKRNDITKIESRLKVNLVLIPNKNLETPHHHIERLRHDDPRLEDSKSSFDLAQAPSTLVEWQPNKAEEARQRPEALVKGITPSQPAPRPQVQAAAAAPAAQGTPKPGLFTRLFSWLSGNAANDAVQADSSTEGAKKTEGSSRRNAQGGNGSRNNRGEGRRERGAQAQQGQADRERNRGRRNERRTDEEDTEQRRNTRQSANGSTRPPRRQPETAPVIEAPAPVAAATEEAQEGGSSRNGRSRRGRGRNRRDEAQAVDNPQATDTSLQEATSAGDNAVTSTPVVAAAAVAANVPAAPAVDVSDSQEAGDTDTEALETSQDGEQVDPERKRRRRRGRRSRRGAEGAATDINADDTAEDDSDANTPATPVSAQVETASSTAATEDHVQVSTPAQTEAAAPVAAEPAIVTHETPKFDPQALTFPSDAAPVTQEQPVQQVEAEKTEPAQAESVQTEPVQAEPQAQSSAPADQAEVTASPTAASAETVAQAPAETPAPIETVINDVAPEASEPAIAKVEAEVEPQAAAPVADVKPEPSPAQTAPASPEAPIVASAVQESGLQLIETRPQATSPEAHDAPKPVLGRARKRVSAVADEPLQQVETH
ncbi:Rne/Rng family ribonuclease [Pusillimonas sp. CC-YST705]|uniref:Ribonuclease E n=1 Tax=Mesopusillimonas faecipullorum TaxID=2755040 RepID=A0ABS8C8U8_9BURK|nr:Rne/Rng family ribonuclease [Mesopusillimonas faecipullorum]MCB5362450.1 Rne/Rng family ribonuclease [Mesopusillimonas faecipullorum]